MVDECFYISSCSCSVYCMLYTPETSKYKLYNILQDNSILVMSPHDLVIVFKYQTLTYSMALFDTKFPAQTIWLKAFVLSWRKAFQRPVARAVASFCLEGHQDMPGGKAGMNMNLGDSNVPLLIYRVNNTDDFYLF